MLFNRIAHNYVKMLFTAPVTEYRDKFLKVWPLALIFFVATFHKSGIAVYDKVTSIEFVFSGTLT